MSCMVRLCLNWGKGVIRVSFVAVEKTIVNVPTVRSVGILFTPFNLGTVVTHKVAVNSSRIRQCICSCIAEIITVGSDMLKLNRDFLHETENRFDQLLVWSFNATFVLFPTPVRFSSFLPFHIPLSQATDHIFWISSNDHFRLIISVYRYTQDEKHNWDA